MFEEEQFDGTTAEDTVLEEQQQEEQNNEDFDFALDDDGNIVQVKREAATPQQEEQQQSALYTAEEVRNTPLENLDPNRLPPELVPFYRSMQADYTRKTQELAVQRKQFEQSLAQPQQPPPQTPVQQPPENVQKAYYEQLYGLAKGNVEKAFGEEFDDLNPLHQSALMDEVANIKVFIIEQQQRQRAYGQVISQYQTDPEWSNMEQFALELLNKLPYDQSVAIRNRIENGDTALLNDFLKYAKQEYYTKVKGVPQQKPQQSQQPKLKPPVLESAGQGVNLSPAQQFDPRNLGKMSTHQQAKIFEDLGLTSL